MRNRFRATCGLVAAALALSALAACGVGGSSASNDTGSSSDGSGSTIKVGEIPVADLATVYLAQDQGFFSDRGLDVEIEAMENASAIVPAVMNGQLQVGTTANVPYLTAKAKGLPILAFANGADTSGDANTDYSGLFVSANGPIKRPRDLEGRTVTTNNLKNVLQLAVAKAVEDDGGDPSKVRFVAMPFPNMVPALAKGSVDAISVVEPFFSAATKAGGRLLFSPYTEAYPKGTTLALYFASEKWLKSNPDQARKFAEAVQEAGAYAVAHPDAIRKVMVDHLGMDAQLAAKVRLPVYGVQLNGDSLEQVAQMMVDGGFVDQAPAEGGLVWKP